MRILSTMGFLLFLGSVVLVGCTPEVASSPASLLKASPTALQPVFIPTITVIPPSSTPVSTAVPILTTAPIILPTPVVPSTAVPLTITQPTTGDSFQVGTEITVNGKTQPGEFDTLVLQVIAASRSLKLVNIPVLNMQTGEWSATFTLPQQVLGPAQLVVSSATRPQTAVAHINLLPDTSQSSYITLNRPSPSDTGVAGYSLLFDGAMKNPVNNSITIRVLSNECTTSVASQSFQVQGMVWYGLLVLPPNVTGPVCVEAFTGTPGQEEWRSSQIEITILPSTDPAAGRVTIGNLVTPISFVAGQDGYLFGTAVNAPNRQVHVVIVEDGRAERVFGEADVAVNEFGFWEVQLPLPEDSLGPARVIVSMGAGDSYIERRTAATIQPQRP